MNGSHLCEGKCGRRVSGNKRKCLQCITKEAEFEKKAGQYTNG